MAKGNLFLGTAAKSVGDVVMYRREGSQVSRVRVRNIANPKTDAQCKQRAIMAPIPKFYSPLAIVLERSFEGLSKSKSYSKFLKVNADKARANDWFLPKGIGFFPLPYTLSQGSLPSLNIKYTSGMTSGFGIANLSYDTAPTTIGNLSQLFIDAGYSNGDVVSIILVGYMNYGSGEPIEQTYFPLSMQFVIDTTATDTIASMMGDMVTWTFSDNNNIFVGQNNVTIVAASAIVARFENEKWRRSSQSLNVETSIMTAIAASANKTAAIASYKGTVNGGNPLVYLDGEELQ